MCLAIPAQISELLDDRYEFATVEVLGVRRRVNIDLLADSPPNVGDWVLVHVGFAMSKISDEQANEQLRLLTMLDEATAAAEEVSGYGEPDIANDDTPSNVEKCTEHMADDLAERNANPAGVVTHASGPEHPKIAGLSP